MTRPDCVPAMDAEAFRGHTPGPWVLNEECGSESVLGPDGIMVADCAIFAMDPMDARTVKINRANAALIAAAPDIAARNDWLEERCARLEEALRQIERAGTSMATVPVIPDGQTAEILVHMPALTEEACIAADTLAALATSAAEEQKAGSDAP